MAKRRQTTGLPKSQRAQRQAEVTPEETRADRPLRGYKSRAERETEIQKYIIWATGAALAVVAMIVLVAFVIDQLINPGRTVASVNDDNISVAEYVDRVRFERLINIERISTAINDNMEEFDLSFEDAANRTISLEPYRTYWDELNIPDQMGLRVLNDMINDELIRVAAAEQGITTSAEEINQKIEELFSFDREFVANLAAEVTEEPTEEPTTTPTPLVSPTPSLEPTQTNTPEVEPTITPTLFPTLPPEPTRSAEERTESFDNTRDDFLSLTKREAGYNEDEVRAFFEVQVLKEKLLEEVIEGGNTETWVSSRHILVETEEEALDIIDALNMGESFAALAQAKGTDGTSSNGGELGWAALSNYVEEFANAIREAPTGEIVGPVQSQFGYHVVQVRAREERDADEATVESQQLDALNEWINELRDSKSDSFETSDIWPDHVPTDPAWQFRSRE